jgi:hypothetical protein
MESEFLDYIAGMEYRLQEMEKRLNDMKLMMRRPGSEDYERLVDVVSDLCERMNYLENCLEVSGIPFEESEIKKIA